MKKFTTVVAAVALLAGTAAVAYRSGINHAVTRSEIWLSEWTESPEGDWIINLDLDGQTYQHTLWVY